MEQLGIQVSGEEYDKAVHSQGPGDVVLKEGQDIRIIAKGNATVGKRPVVCITFTVELPDGTFARAQAVTTLRNLVMATEFLKYHKELQ